MLAEAIGRFDQLELLADKLVVLKRCLGCLLEKKCVKKPKAN